MDNIIQIGTLQGVVPIAILCWLLGTAVKNTASIEDKHIPVIVGVFGLILGIAGHFINILGLGGMDIYTAGSVGILSSFMSVYVSQLQKQYSSNNSNKD